MSDPKSPTAPLRGTFFQLGYVARDLDRALAIFEERYGVRDFQRYMSNSEIDVALAYRGDTMIEIIVPHRDDDPLYGQAKAQGELVLHHLGYLVDDEEWRQIHGKLSDLGVPVTKASPKESPVGFVYADTREDLGHYSEYVYLPAGSAIFAGVPRN